MVSRHSSLPGQSSAPARAPQRPVQLVGHRIRRLRKERRLSLDELATAIGIQTADLMRLEKGEYRASLDVLFRILGALEIDGEALFAEVSKEGPVTDGRHAIREL
jgi:transcriptional regulator with XRE-family HTH domain